METVNIQLNHMTQVASAFMSASYPLNVIGMFRSTGIMLWLVRDGNLIPRVSSERTRCLIIGFSLHEEIVPIENKIGKAQTEPYFEHCAGTIAEEISSEA
jgi:hypothetical protein